MGEFDLEDDWAELRGNGKAVPVAVVDTKNEEELESSWRALKNIPDFVYQAHKGYGIDSMAIYEYHCLGQQELTRMGKVVDCWKVKFSRVIWSGPEAKVPHSYISGGIYATSKTQLDVLLDDAILRLETYREEHLKMLLSDRVLIEKRINEQLTHLTRCVRQIEAAENADMITVVLDGLRSALLGVIQTNAQKEQQKLLQVLEQRTSQITIHQLAKMSEKERSVFLQKLTGGRSEKD